jgi:hypothetical protein
MLDHPHHLAKSTQGARQAGFDRSAGALEGGGHLLLGEVEEVSIRQRQLIGLRQLMNGSQQLGSLGARLDQDLGR